MPITRLLAAATVLMSSTVSISASPVDAPGVKPKRIKIGIHAPITGAAPLPVTSVERGAGLYFRWLEEQGIKINGRYVDVVLRNDNSNPSQAVAVCKEMVNKDEVFLLVGVAGAEQIQACARYAASVGVPYISWGASKAYVKKLPRYFATSMPYEKQAALLADLLVEKHDALVQQNAIVWPNSPVYRAARNRFKKSMDKRGASVDLDRSVSITAGTSEAQTIASEMALAGIDNAVFLGRPTFWIQLEGALRNQGVEVRWAGIAPMLGTDGVVGIMCNQSDGELMAETLSYVPAFADRDSYDDTHDRAMQKLYGERGDDTTWAGWAMGRNIAEMLRQAPRGLTHRSFTAAVTDSTIATGIGPNLPFGSGGPFVAREAHLLRADCVEERWETRQAFVSGF
jgi:branched-chain amino acid transport system substrate-binding protein